MKKIIFDTPDTINIDKASVKYGIIACCNGKLEGFVTQHYETNKFCIRYIDDSVSTGCNTLKDVTELHDHLTFYQL